MTGMDSERSPHRREAGQTARRAARIPAMNSERRSRLARWWREWILPVACVLVLLGSFRSAVADWNDIPSGSMRPTILEGDRVVIDKLAYDVRVPFLKARVAELAAPERGDVVVFPSPIDGRRMIKRIVALPGETVEFRNGRLVVDGRAAPCTAADAELLEGVPAADRRGVRLLTEDLDGHAHPIQTERRTGGSFGPLRVPEGHYFVAGDNRDNSLDSRVFGPIAREAIEGRAFAIALSVDPEHCFVPRWGRFFSKLP
jgi:signal peptidase I